MLGLCEFLRSFTARPAPPSYEHPTDDEAAAIVDLYFREHSEPVDPGLLERLLWWEGVELPARSLYRAYARLGRAAA